MIGPVAYCRKPAAYARITPYHRDRADFLVYTQSMRAREGILDSPNGEDVVRRYVGDAVEILAPRMQTAPLVLSSPHSGSDYSEDFLGASRLKDLGRCMSALKERYPGMIESGAAGKAVRKALSRAS